MPECINNIYDKLTNNQQKDNNIVFDYERIYKILFTNSKFRNVKISNRIQDNTVYIGGLSPPGYVQEMPQDIINQINKLHEPTDKTVQLIYKIIVLYINFSSNYGIERDVMRDITQILNNNNSLNQLRPNEFLAVISTMLFVANYC